VAVTFFFFIVAKNSFYVAESSGRKVPFIISLCPQMKGIPMSEEEKIKKGICPSCDAALAFQEGCKTCFCCGWGGCSV
jgi:hypothetical protein